MKNQILYPKMKLAKSVLIISCLIIACFSNLQAQNNERTVTGTVLTQDGPLEGATVILKGTSTTTTTDSDGKFTFPRLLTENDVLLFSYLGYKEQEIRITKATTTLRPFLEDIPVLIVADLRTSSSKVKPQNGKHN